MLLRRALSHANRLFYRVGIFLRRPIARAFNVARVKREVAHRHSRRTDGHRLRHKAMPFGGEHEIFPATGKGNLAHIQTIPSRSSLDEDRLLPRNRAIDCDRKTDALTYSVCSFNVLADIYCQTGHWQGIYGAYCDKGALEWEHRLPLIRERLKTLSPDVICLQEVMIEHCDADYRGFFDDLGYDMIMQHNKKMAKGHSTGNATLYKRSKFEKCEIEEHRSRALIVGLVLRSAVEGEESGIVIESSADSAASHSTSSTISSPNSNNASVDSSSSSSVLSTSTTVPASEEKKAPQSGQRQPKKKKKKKEPQFKMWPAETHIVWVCNVHLQGDPYASDLRFNQINSSLKELRKLQSRHHPKVQQKHSLTHICGDFNAGADSAVYKALERGSLDKDYCEIVGMRTLRPLKKAFSHEYGFSSANHECLGYEPTTFAVRNMKYDCLDFLFFNGTRLHVLAALEPLTEQEAMLGIPSPAYPSDHAAIAALFRVGEVPAPAPASVEKETEKGAE
jgi:mRNA deadenylase 3'-5' endonuclease subunit Ccr4